jgi:hypothetical protein
MGCDVFANGSEIACKAGGNKVIAAMPDVCLSPPSPPAGPVPIPYPNTSFSKDMQQGSKTVLIKGKEVMLKDQSFYKTSAIGDEPATKGLGASVITHVITGTTYCQAWSMDVQFEGANVDRHMDITSSNHASKIGGRSTPLPTTGEPAPPAAPPDPEEEKRKKCGEARTKINEKHEKLKKEFRKYNPKKDARGGFPMGGGKLTKPGGHYKEMRDLQRGLRRDIAEYERECGKTLDPRVEVDANKEVAIPPGQKHIPINFKP